MLRRLANFIYRSSVVRQLRPIRLRFRQALPLFGRIDSFLIRFIGSRLEAGFSEPLIEKGRVSQAQLNLINWRLWSGHSEYAKDVLKRISLSSKCERNVRAEAALYLAAWCAAEGDPRTSLKLQEDAIGLAPNLGQSSRYILLRIDNLLECGNKSEANEYRSKVELYGSNNCHVEWGLANTLESDQWLLAVNKLFRSVGLCELEKKKADGALCLGNLRARRGFATARAQVCTEDQPLITVIIPAFNAADRISIALESLLDQTWSNFEILVVDDFSKDQTKEVVLGFTERDARVKYVAMPENRGSYSARNHGLTFAQGEFITTHDIDDWSHPEKLMEQACHLLNSASCVGNVSAAVRCTESMRFLGNWRPNGLLIKQNLSSFMFRRSILERVGEWDAVRIGGDSEFLSRVKLIFGGNRVSVVRPESPLSFVLGDHDSLTSVGATHIRTFYYGVRREYAAMSSFWHQRLAERACLNDKPVSSVPLMIRPDRSSEVSLTTLILLDAANDEVAIAHVVDLVERSEAGTMVGVFHWPDFGMPREADIAPRLRALAFEGRLSVILPGQIVTARAVVVASEPVWRSPPDAYPEIVLKGGGSVQALNGGVSSIELLGLPGDMVIDERSSSVLEMGGK